MQSGHNNPPSSSFFFNTPTRSGGGDGGGSGWGGEQGFNPHTYTHAPPGTEAAAAADGVQRIQAKLAELDRICLEARHEEGKLLQEQQRVALIEEVAYKATELNKIREELGKMQDRRAAAEQRVRAHELLGTIRKTIEDAEVCAGKVGLMQER